MKRWVGVASARSPSLSPDGQTLAFIRVVDAQEQLVVVDLKTGAAKALQTFDSRGGDALRWVRWKGNDRLVLGATLAATVKGRAPTGGMLKADDRTYRFSRVYALGVDGSNVVQRFEGQLGSLEGRVGSTWLVDDLSSDADHVLVSAIDTSGMGAWRANIRTGKATRIANGDWSTYDYYTDGAGNPVIRVDWHENRERWMRRAPGAEAWSLAYEVRRNTLSASSPEFAVEGPGPGPGQVCVRARAGGSDLMNLYLYDTSTGEFGQPVLAGVSADVSGGWIHPVSRQLLAACIYGPRLDCRGEAPNVQAHIKALDAFFEGRATVSLASMSADASRWLLHVDSPQEPPSLYLYDRQAGSVDKLMDMQPGVPIEALSPTEVVAYTARDGAKLWAYVTGRSGAGPAPMDVMPHGGPESRDGYGFDAFVQFLASHGYLVVQPNFRGPAGGGADFATAGRGQWGLRMQDDISDAVKHLVESGRADGARVCIVGGSYGGYAALAGVTMTPDLYRCAVSIAGVSDLTELLRTERTDAGADSNVYHYWRDSIGDRRANAGVLAAASPRKLAARVTAPVLLIHGEKDLTVVPRQSAIMQDALNAAGKPVRYIRLPDADHVWTRWTVADRERLFSETAAFLAEHLGPAS